MNNDIAIMYSNILSDAEQSYQEILEKDLKDIDITLLNPFPNHSFTLYNDEKRKEMNESIKQHGIINPIIIWENEGKYYILSGHNRVESAKQLGIDKVKCLVRTDINYEEAEIIVIESNLSQRGFSELSLKDKIEVAKKYYKLKKENLNISKRTIYRYLNYENLIDEFIVLLDTGDITSKFADKITTLDQSEQLIILNAIRNNIIFGNDVAGVDKILMDYQLNINSTEDTIKDEEVNQIQEVSSQKKSVSQKDKIINIVDKVLKKVDKQEVIEFLYDIIENLEKSENI